MHQKNTLQDMILPAQENYTRDVLPEHDAEPIKQIEDIERIVSFLLNEKRYRDYLLFVTGINLGLRISDLRILRFGDIITDDFQFRETIPVLERKTRNTRKQNRNRHVTINRAVQEAVTTYLTHTPNTSLSDYMFTSQSNRGGNLNKPLTLQSVHRIMKDIAKNTNITTRVSTHTLRKTFCYWMMVEGGNDPRRLMLLQKMLGHSTPSQTLTYIGITADEAAEAYASLNLGVSKSKLETLHKLVKPQIIYKNDGILETETKTGVFVGA